jgi:hypothetical protein
MTVCFRDFINGNSGLATFSPTNSAMGRFVKGMKFQYVGSNIYMPTIAYVSNSLLVANLSPLPPPLPSSSSSPRILFGKEGGKWKGWRW